MQKKARDLTVRELLLINLAIHAPAVPEWFMPWVAYGSTNDHSTSADDFTLREIKRNNDRYAQWPGYYANMVIKALEKECEG